MNFIIVGCGRVGAELCYHLFKGGHNVVVVDSKKEAFNRLHPDFRGRTLEGEGLAESVLERAGIREADGLAMSSRNMRLSLAERRKAVLIFQSLSFIKNNLVSGETETIKNKAIAMRTREGFRVDYIEIADAKTLKAVNNWDGKKKLVALVAAFLNEVRLIDNLLLN